RNPDAEIDDLVARGWSQLHDLCARYLAVGFSKLVLVPLSEPRDWNDELAAGASALLPLQG
ncbi:MAG TPA: TIGR03854 family LLM class F420-dependent oxidoreductase, partial [Acidimicrobiia bacterium]